VRIISVSHDKSFSSYHSEVTPNVLAAELRAEGPSVPVPLSGNRPPQVENTLLSAAPVAAPP